MESRVMLLKARVYGKQGEGYIFAFLSKIGLAHFLS